MNIDRTYQFTDGSTFNISQMEVEFDTISSTWNKHNTGVSYWDQTYTYGPLRVGLAAITSFSATAATTVGATLAANTYYYKVYAFSTGDKVGIPSPELEVVVGGANNSVNMSWDAVQGASYYRVQRDTTAGGGAGGGYFQTTSTTFSDIGQAFTASGGVITASENCLAYVSGTIFLPAGTASINWYNYDDGVVGGHISVTSAGEFEVSTGSGGADGTYLFEISDFTIRLMFLLSTTTPIISYQTDGAYYDGILRGKTLAFQCDTTEYFKITSSALTSKVPFQITSSSALTLPFYVTSTNASDLRNAVYVNNATGDPYWNFATNATNWSIGIDNSDTDAFVVTKNSTLDGTNYIKITTGGQVQLGSGTGAVNLQINSQTGGGSSTGTLTNAKSATNPAIWVKIDINGSTYEFPGW